MHWLLGGYMWLYIHRPFEYYPRLGDLQVERVYVLLMLVAWVVSPAKGLVANRIHAAFAAFVLAVTACWLASPFRDQGYEVVEHLAKVSIFYLLFVTTVRDEAGLRRVLVLYLLAVGLYMGHSLLEYCNGRFEYRMNTVRMIGVDVTYRDPNSFSSTLLLALVMTLPLWGRAKTLAARLPLLAFSAVACLCILLTGSRTGLMGLGLFAFFCLLGSRSRKGLAVVLLAGALVAAAALPGYLQDRFLTIVDPSRGPRNAQESAEGRLAGITLGLELFSQSPLLGVGPGGFPYATRTGYNPHNLYAQLLSETGLVGAAAFGSLLWCFFRNWRETRRRGREQPDAASGLPYQVSRAVGLCVLLLLFQGIAGHNLYRYAWLWFAAFQACAVHCLRARAGAPALAAAGARNPPRLPAFPGRPAFAGPPGLLGR
jgi:O-antigen ligase